MTAQWCSARGTLVENDGRSRGTAPMSHSRACFKRPCAHMPIPQTTAASAMASSTASRPVMSTRNTPSVDANYRQQLCSGSARFAR